MFEEHISWQQMQILVMTAIAIEGSQKKAAKTFGVSPQYLSDVIRGRREITDKIANYFGVERCVVYKLMPGVKLGDITDTELPK
jgi:phage portal protein BeeE